MNTKALAYQVVIFSVQWALMLAGFGILSEIVAPVRLLNPSVLELSVPYWRYLEAGVKALVALCLSLIWLFLWDRQVRFLFYRRREDGTI